MDQEDKVMKLASEYAQVLLEEWALCHCVGNKLVLTKRLVPLATDTVTLMSHMVTPDERELMLAICASADTQYCRQHRKDLTRGLHKPGASLTQPRAEAEEAGVGPYC